MAIERRHANPDYTIRGNGRYYPPYSGDTGTAVDEGGKRRGFADKTLWKFMRDIQYEPRWRREAELDVAFYDGDQLKSETLQRMKELGIPPLVTNMIAPIVDGIIGWEAIARANLKCLPENEESYEIAQAFNIKMKEAMRMTKFDRGVGLSFRDAVKIGLGWIEVARNDDPFKYPYKVARVPWREMYVDYQSREEDYSDARYTIRRRWYDADVLKSHLPKYKKLIDAMAGGHQDTLFAEWSALGYDDIAQSYAMSLHQEPRETLEELEWINTERKRLALYEICYKKPRQVECIRLPNGITVELDTESPEQLRALASGQAQYINSTTMDMRQAYYLGPVQLYDRKLELNMPHYIPIVAKRKDNDGQPYGAIRNLRSPQEGYNARITRLMYDTTSRKYVIDDDAVDDHSETAQELNKINSYVILRGDRIGKGIEMMPSLDMTPITFQLAESAKMSLHDVSGIRPEFMGGVQSAGESGVAIDQIIHQTQQVLGSLVDNYRTAKQMAGEVLMGLVMHDLSGQQEVAFETEESPKRKIVLNHRDADGTKRNDVLTARMRIALGEVPASQTYLQSKLTSLAEIVKSMPPELQPIFSDLIVKAYSPEDMEEILERIRSVTGYGPEPKDPQKREELAQQQAQQQEMQQRAQEAEIANLEADVDVKKADALERTVRAEKLADADTDLTEAKTLAELAKAGDVETQSQLKEKEVQIKGLEAAARLEKERNAEKQKAKEKKSGGS